MEVPRHWRLNKQRYGLIGEKDVDGYVIFPPGNRSKFDPVTGLRKIESYSESDLKVKPFISIKTPTRVET